MVPAVDPATNPARRDTATGIYSGAGFQSPTRSALHLPPLETAVHRDHQPLRAFDGGEPRLQARIRILDRQQPAQLQLELGRHLLSRQQPARPCVQRRRYPVHEHSSEYRRQPGHAHRLLRAGHLDDHRPRHRQSRLPLRTAGPGLPGRDAEPERDISGSPQRSADFLRRRYPRRDPRHLEYLRAPSRNHL